MMDLRNSNIKNLKELEFIMKYNSDVTEDNIAEIAFDEKAYEKALELANERMECELLL